jgi:hypothetical protein
MKEAPKRTRAMEGTVCFSFIPEKQTIAQQPRSTKGIRSANIPKKVTLIRWLASELN